MNWLCLAAHTRKGRPAFFVAVFLCSSLISWTQVPPDDPITAQMNGSRPEYQKDAAPDTAPLKIVHELPVVSLCINGHGPYDLLLDTGTDSTLVDKDLARELELVIKDRTQLISPNGRHPVGRALAAEVLLGSRKLTNVEFLVDDLRELHSLSSHLRGILGKNILTQFNFLLDYRHHKLELHPLGEEPPGIEIPFELANGRMILNAEEFPGGEKLRLQLDSGASNTLLFRPSLQIGLQHTGNAFLSTNQGATGVYETRIRELHVGPAVLRDVQTGILSRLPMPGIDGLLPTNLFDTVYFDFARGFISVTGSKVLHENGPRASRK